MSASRDEDRLLDHRYDDIQEYDNPLPGWWTLVLWATIVWGVAYWFNVPGSVSARGDRQLRRLHRGGRGGVPQPVNTRPDVAALVAMNRRCRRARRRHDDVPDHVRRVPRRGRWRQDRTEPDRRLLASWRLAGRVLATIADGVLEKGMPRGAPP